MMINVNIYMLDFCLKCSKINMSGDVIRCNDYKQPDGIDRACITYCLDNNCYEVYQRVK